MQNIPNATTIAHHVEGFGGTATRDLLYVPRDGNCAPRVVIVFTHPDYEEDHPTDSTPMVTSRTVGIITESAAANMLQVLDLTRHTLDAADAVARTGLMESHLRLARCNPEGFYGPAFGPGVWFNHLDITTFRGNMATGETTSLGFRLAPGESAALSAALRADFPNL